MVVVPLTQPERETAIDRRRSDSDAMNWARFAAGGTLLAGGVLMLTGNRKAGLVTAASGAALAILDQQETVKAWWDALPGYIDKVQHVLGQVEQTVAEVAAERGYAISTVEGHLAHFVAQGELDALHFVSASKIMRIREIADSLENPYSGMIKQSLGDEFSYSDIKFAMAAYKHEKKMKELP